ncbi:glycosyltransferase family 2 protein [Bacteroidales bacterium OttesenSCG-928-I14]|nr:glycosyltransferase family 2 protein [Bacteroidales bacterium OttesenSCG-928-I14]
MKHNILISIIVPAYNAEPYIAQCIENLLSQTYKNIEVIVIDDGSVDKSYEIAQSYPVKVIKHPVNKGLAAARNTGIAEAQGEYLHFMDADDLVNLEFYEKMIDAAIQTGADMSCCGMINECQPNRDCLFEHRLVVSTAQDKVWLTNVGQYGYAVRYLFKTSYLRENKLLFEEGRLIEDLPYSIKAVYQANKVVSVPGAVYVYKHRYNSILTSVNKELKAKRREDWKYAKSLRSSFATEYKLNLDDTLTRRTQYELFKIPILTKREYYSGIKKWYMFGLCVYQTRVMRTK